MAKIRLFVAPHAHILASVVSSSERPGRNALAAPRRAVSDAAGAPMIMATRPDEQCPGFAQRDDQYETNNIPRVEVASRDVAELAAEMCGPLFARTTGARIPVDGGNERVI